MPSEGPPTIQMKHEVLKAENTEKKGVQIGVLHAKVDKYEVSVTSSKPILDLIFTMEIWKYP